MYLDQKELENLKNLIFGKIDEENPNKCMECKQDSLEYCEFADLCGRYGTLFRTEKENMLKDLFDTIEHMRRLINILTFDGGENK